MSPEIIVAIIAGLAASLPGIAALIAQRRRERAESAKADADASDVITEAALKLIKPCKDRLSELEAQVKSIKVERDAQEERIEILEAERHVRDQRRQALEAELATMHQRLAALEGQIAGLQTGAKQLWHQVRQAGLVPEFTPPGVDDRLPNPPFIPRNPTISP